MKKLSCDEIIKAIDELSLEEKKNVYYHLDNILDEINNDNYEDYSSNRRGYSAEGYELNDIGIECGLEDCALSDDERYVFCK